ncbi:methionyl-tRNA formyltransferase [Povalibacter uvarum]|uniref:Methionyl-tRNA formyltransferase n=1 Tax=Povalibacter uvarum TaxID=732238 RepID=A0A841HMR5_9GAMM|nr:methionyl-tRNA formyltransferase [Povalibacter uvarum]MBB6093372.1 methionyl-tRNA formyltransferase [Povalibacter uvarum]
MPASLSIVFAGTPEFSVPALEALVASRHRVVAVYTQPDRPAGRGQQLAMSAVKQCALKHSLRVEQPQTLRDPAAVERLAQMRPDVMVVVAYGLILPADVLAIPRMGCLNIHASLLPRWRGAAPIHRALLAGDSQTGVTIMQMDVGLDTGPMLLERTMPIGNDDTASSLHDRLAQMGAEALLETIDGLLDGSIAPRTQPAEGATYAAKIRKEEALIDWTRSASELDRQVRAFNPWPVAETRWNGQQLRVWQANLADTHSSAAPGTLLGGDANGIRVATGSGVLNLTRVQLAGRKAVTAAEFLNAQRLDGASLA